MVRQSSMTQHETSERPDATTAPTIGTVAREVGHGRTTIVLTWDLRSGEAGVWALLTNPSELRKWAPYTADRDLSRVGRAVLTMLGDGEVPDIEVPSVVLVADSPRVLEHSWASDVLAWRITSAGDGCRLTLRQTLADDMMASANAAGWHLCMEVARDVLAGRRTAPVRGREAMKHGWSELNEAYAAALQVAPSRLG